MFELLGLYNTQASRPSPSTLWFPLPPNITTSSADTIATTPVIHNSFGGYNFRGRSDIWRRTVTASFSFISLFFFPFFLSLSFYLFPSLLSFLSFLSLLLWFFVSFFLFISSFLDASSHLYKVLFPSVGPSVRPFIHLSVCPWRFFFLCSQRTHLEFRPCFFLFVSN